VLIVDLVRASVKNQTRQVIDQKNFMRFGRDENFTKDLHLN
jgi:hypothetical protein